MAKLTFYYSVMAAGKSTFCLQLNHSLKQRNFNPLLIKSSVDTRDVGEIKSRIGLSEPCITIYTENDLLSKLRPRLHGITHLLIDEVQFLTPCQIWDLSDIVDQFNIDVICFGLRTDYTGKLFNACNILFAIADDLVELPMMDSDGNKAIMHLKTINGVNVFTGDPIEVGGDEKYTSVSRKIWKKLKSDSERA